MLDHNASTGNGLVFSSSELVNHLQRLDEFEGDGYQRVVTTACLASGERVDAFVYELSEAGRK